jgi:putative YhdH/YhfP family quinone oxidoreductase
MDDFIFKALVVAEREDKRFCRSIEDKRLSELPAGEVIIEVSYSSLNYKDALSASGNRGVTRRYPHTPGIDAVGVVHSSLLACFTPGDKVLCMGYGLGMNTAGGFGQYISVPAAWVMALPEGLSRLESMQLGTAGFTAAQCVDKLICSGLRPETGEVLVTGATGGVGSIAVRLLAHLGFQVVAVTGKRDQADFLLSMGAARVLAREKFLAGKNRMLLRERWAGVVDTVGGDILANALKGTIYGGTVACCGNAASSELPVSVYPFILKGVTLAGIDSAGCSMARRESVWKMLAGSWKFAGLEELCRVIYLAGLESEIDKMLKGQALGRVVVNLKEKK